MRMDETPQRGNHPNRERPPGRKSQRTTWLLMAAGLAMAIVCPWAMANIEDSSRAADALLRLVPPDASACGDGRGTAGPDPEHRRLPAHRRSPPIAGREVMARFREVPAFAAVVRAGRGGAGREAGRDPGPGARAMRWSWYCGSLPATRPIPSQARGLLLLRARDPALLDRLISAFNAAQRDSGELKRVDVRRRGDTTYHVREFPEGSGRPPEWYVGYPDGTFAFSNSEEMIQGVVDRKPPGPSLAELALVGGEAGEHRDRSRPGRVAATDRRASKAPGAAAGALYVDPRAVERLLGLATRRLEAVRSLLPGRAAAPSGRGRLCRRRAGLAVGCDRRARGRDARRRPGGCLAPPMGRRYADLSAGAPSSAADGAGDRVRPHRPDGAAGGCLRDRPRGRPSATTQLRDPA